MKKPADQVIYSTPASKICMSEWLNTEMFCKLSPLDFERFWSNLKQSEAIFKHRQNQNNVLKKVWLESETETFYFKKK